MATAVQVGTRIALQNVLFATDFSPCSNAALPYATSFARRHNATLHAVHVRLTDADLLFMSPDNWPGALEDEDKQVRGNIEQLETQLRGLPHDVLTPKGKVADALARIVAEKKIDLLVLGTHGRTGVRKLFAGSVAEEVFRSSSCAVLTVGPKVSSEPSGQIQFRHILFATDFSEDSLAALPLAISLAEEDEARLSILHVIDQPAAGIMHLEDVRRSLKARLQELVKPEDYPWCRAECSVEFSRQFAPPAERILEIAQDRAVDLIVVGVRRTHGTGTTVTHLTPTTAQHIVAHAECPVLTVRRTGSR
jgi:nucleotide-binding universal stress UspA family protein